MGSQTCSSAHIVAIPFIWQGHETPLLHLCRHLAASGCTVTLLNAAQDPQQRGQELYDHGVQILSALPLDPPKAPPAVLGEQPDQEYEVVRSYLAEFQALGDNHLTLPIFEEISRKSEAPVTCLISDVYVGWAPKIAAHLGVEWIAFWTSTVAELVIYYHMPRLIADDIFPFAGPFSEDPITGIPGLPELLPVHYPSFGFIPTKPLRNILHTFKDLVQRIPHASRLLVNSMQELEAGPIESLRSSNVNVQPVGPLHLLSEKLMKAEDPDGVLQWLDSKKKSSSIVYIAFGTTMSVAAEQFEELARALEESGQEFVWAIRSSVLDLLPEGFVERMRGKNQGLVVLWAPQIEVLKHSAIGAFFTHCGWNSVLEAISIGMPMIARPVSGDQVLTKKFLVEEWGIALGLGGGEVASREEIKKTIKILMEEDQGQVVRKKAGEMKDLVQKSSNGSSRANLSALVQHLRPN